MTTIEARLIVRARSKNIDVDLKCHLHFFELPEHNCPHFTVHPKVLTFHT